MADYTFPEDLMYTREDEWARRDGERVLVGITDYAQDQLGDIVFVELPAVGARVEKGQSFGVIESVKAVSDLYAPVSGEVTEVNEALGDRPEAINEDCYGDGWIIAINSGEEDADMLDAEGYRKFVEERSD